MASISSTNFSNFSYLMKHCYSSDRRARKAVGRTTMTAAELAKADSQALKKLAQNFKETTYDKEHGAEIYNNAKAFVETYNNLLDSTDKCISDDVERYAKKMKKLIKKHADDFEEIGIKLSSSGKLKLDKEDLLKTTPSKIERIFGKDSSLPNDIVSISTKLIRSAKNLIHSDASIKSSKTDDPLVTALLNNSNNFDAKA